jgi:radical SAM superfamily enzyme YgiQ (UPF0313 family)
MHIGFLAISGLRLCDQRLLELGFSFPAVARRAREIEALPSLGLLTLAGQTPAHISCEYLEIRADSVAEPRFDAVALSTLTATSREAFAVAAKYRALGIPVILGGLHATLCPEDCSLHVDSVVIGEGELVWPQILKDLESGNLQPSYNAKLQGPFDLALAPLPRYDLLAANRYPRFTVQTQRGCPWACEFCAASIRLSPKFRTKPVPLVIREIRELKSLYRRPFLEFADDNTFADKRHGKELMRAVAKEQVRWFTETDISVADDPELLRLMRDAGCHQVLIGLESPTQGRLQGMELNANWKEKRMDRYLRAIDTIQSHGITVNGCFIMGLDGDGVESFDAVFDFVQRSSLYDVQITYLTPFPGTPLWQRLSEAGRLISTTAMEKCSLFDINFHPTHQTVDELRDGFHQLTARLYAPEFVAARTRNFRRQKRKAICPTPSV